MAGALLIDSIIYTVILYFTNWERQAELAQKRVTINCASRQDQEETTGVYFHIPKTSISRSIQNLVNGRGITAEYKINSEAKIASKAWPIRHF